MAVAQKFLRHSDVRLTIHTYGHLDVEDVRQGIARSFAGTAPEGLRTANGLQTGPEEAPKASPSADETAARSPQALAAPDDSSPAPVRRGARTARSAASARTRCSWAA